MTVPDVATRASRIRAAESAGSASRKLELIAQLGSLQRIVTQQREQLAADEKVLAALFEELEAIERDDQARARALAPSPGLFATLGEACAMARCNEATMRKKLRANQHLGWKVNRRWKISRPELIAHLAALDG
ncbi:hypothetical protein [Methylobacterium sp. E-046]|uniref:hypothetical protein n=1 Tax=Methylobacterium sp. E-046 TaxID=2836576 RepID=UPI001FB87E3D|nr:hypothetical protein [Methylobacterium sp. E-046]MCJ2102710.1 hypothetical protein [Methylobacterium sp. E-046]